MLIDKESLIPMLKFQIDTPPYRLPFKKQRSTQRTLRIFMGISENIAPEKQWSTESNFVFSMGHASSSLPQFWDIYNHCNVPVLLAK